MSELTKEYLDSIVQNLATKQDLEALPEKLKAQGFATKDDLVNFATKDDLVNFATKDDLVNFATKDDLKAQTAELKAFAVEQTEELARIIAGSLAVPVEEIKKEVKDLRKDLNVLSYTVEHNTTKLEKHLDIELEHVV